MIKTPKARILNAVRVLALSFLGLICLAPFYVAVCYAFKSKVDLAQTKLAFPTHLYLGNFIDALNVRTSLIPSKTVQSLPSAWWSSSSCSVLPEPISSQEKITNFTTPFITFFSSSSWIPFQTVMFPLYKDWSAIGALNTLWGLCLAQAGVNVGYYVFLYTGFIKNVPISLEEAASIDGCNRYQTFFYVVFPLLKPITMTSIVLAFLASWNDFIISMIICQKLDRPVHFR